MRQSLILFAAVAALAAGPALAAEGAAAPTQAPAQPEPQQPAASVRHCWKENPYNEYRDCVNASTRDPNAKIRMA
jgi:hypothetical protein